MTNCLCGCDTLTDAVFAPGHDTRALGQVIRTSYVDSRDFVRRHGGDASESTHAFVEARRVAVAHFGSIEKCVTAHR